MPGNGDGPFPVPDETPILVTVVYQPTCAHGGPTDVTHPEGMPPTVSCGECGLPYEVAP